MFVVDPCEGWLNIFDGDCCAGGAIARVLEDRTLKLWNFPTEEQEALALERTQQRTWRQGLHFESLVSIKV